MKYILFSLGLLVFWCCSTSTSKTKRTPLLDTLLIKNRSRTNQHKTSFETYRLNTKDKGLFPICSQKKLNKKDLEHLSKSTLSLALNEIFARNGYTFKTDQWKHYFSTQDWYKPYHIEVDSLLTNIEHHNIQLLSQAELITITPSKKEELDFYKSYLDSTQNTYIPGLLGYQFGESCPDCLKEGILHTLHQEVFKEDSLVHLIYREYTLCNECPYKFYLETYSTDGQLVHKDTLLTTYSTVVFKNNNNALYIIDATEEDTLTFLKP